MGESNDDFTIHLHICFYVRNSVPILDLSKHLKMGYTHDTDALIYFVVNLEPILVYDCW